ncbi:hypothetical protein GCM10011312_20110 [Planktosalinus lacus]|uniref:MotA/TolQ/ExbB proton channel domain-containing protein n=2 Tax=Planktosalinus lacus TaxID=1526573 RepID=A0A8J2YA84_9FLAO|nr:hypothetical protein GCM10011312_20110 [Planktosalinus lacus]
MKRRFVVCLTKTKDMTALPLVQNRSIFNELANRFSEGGPFFMTLILICFLLALVFLVLGFIYLKKNPQKSAKMINLTSEVSILGLVIGLLGSIIGLIEAFDTVEALENISVMGSGLKVSFLTTLFGSITFILPRIGIIILKGIKKIEAPKE